MSVLYAVFKALLLDFISQIPFHRIYNLGIVIAFFVLFLFLMNEGTLQRSG